TIIPSSGWPSAGAIDSELCQSASRRARQAAFVGSAPLMSVPMPISSTIRFFVIVSPPVVVECKRTKQDQITPPFCPYAAFRGRSVTVRYGRNRDHEHPNPSHRLHDD